MKKLSFFVTSMPDSRPANYYLGCLEGSVYIDFNDYNSEFICLKRISFDGYGCCEPKEPITPMNLEDSMKFKNIINNKILDQNTLKSIIIKTIKENREILWEDALIEYGFLHGPAK